MRRAMWIGASFMFLVAVTAGCGPGSGQAGGEEKVSSASTTLPTVNPQWKVLVLVYLGTDFTYTASSGVVRHVRAALTPDEIARATTAARRFYEEDVPILTSGNMQPTVTVRYPLVLSSLSRWDAGYWPSAGDVAADRDPGFDSIVVVWAATGTDLNSGETVTLNSYAAGTSHMGLGQTYSALTIGSISSTNRNVFKHEWGHSVLFYHEALGVAPLPAVDNHINDTTTRYVNCLNNTAYVLVDEEDYAPIPNSIYNDAAGFTHDYYSGRTATADQPGRCLGITPQAWLAGGPVTKPDPAGGLTTAVTITNEWITGYCASVTVQNTSAQPLTWSVEIPISGHAYTTWGATSSQSGRQLSLSGLEWNHTLTPGQSTSSIGFCANR